MLKLVYMDPNQQQHNQGATNIQPSSQPSPTGQPGQPPLSTAYLDEIATPVVVKTGPSLKKILIIGGASLFVVLGLLFAVTKFSGTSLTPVKQLAGKMYGLNNVVETTIKKRVIKDNKLRALNTTLSLVLKDTIRDTTPGFAAQGIKMERLKSNKEIIALENTVKLEELLEDARLNGNFDQTYTIEMIYELTSLINLMERVSKTNVGVNMKAALLKGIDNLTPVLEQLEDYNKKAKPAY